MKAERVADDQMRGTVDGERAGTHPRPTLRGVPERGDLRTLVGFSVERRAPGPGNPHQRVSRGVPCGHPTIRRGTRGPRPLRCARCRDLDRARWYAAAAARLAASAGDEALAESLRRLSAPLTDVPAAAGNVADFRNYPAARVTLTIEHVRLDEVAGPQLSALRWSLGLTVAAIAAAAGISETRVRRLEQQERMRGSTAARYIDAVRAAHERRVIAARATTLRLALAGIGVHP